jgi:hypothetical protein
MLSYRCYDPILPLKKNSFESVPTDVGIHFMRVGPTLELAINVV